MRRRRHNGFDESLNQCPRRIWVLNNEFRSSGRGVRVEGSQDVWILGNVLSSLDRAIQIDTWRMSIAVDREGTMRPAGSAMDNGALERP